MPALNARYGQAVALFKFQPSHLFILVKRPFYMPLIYNKV